MGADVLNADDRYVVISADCHGGGEIHEYRDFLASQYHDEFDAWVDGYPILFPDLLGDLGQRNWDSDRRVRDLEADGIVAEVHLPQHHPAVLPGWRAGHAGTARRRRTTSSSGGPGSRRTTAGSPTSARARPAVAPASRRSCCTTSTRTVEEIRWAHANGLTGGILLPGAPPGVGLLPLHSQHYDPIWTVCEELGMPVNHHGGSAGPPRAWSRKTS